MTIYYIGVRSSKFTVAERSEVYRMFTGLIEEVGRVRRLRRVGLMLHLEIEASSKFLTEVRESDSVAVDGICLTVVEVKRDSFSVEVVRATREKTSLGDLSAGDRVNLERSLRLGDRVGGHLVTGHIDGVGEIMARRGGRDDFSLWISAPGGVMDYVITRGAIAVDGVSLTVAEHRKDSFKVNVIPFTVKMTTLGSKRVGDKVNLEGDLIGKYVKKYSDKDEEIDVSFLMEKGFI